MVGIPSGVDDANYCHPRPNLDRVYPVLAIKISSMKHEYHTNDSPKRFGYDPQSEDIYWTFIFSLANGDRLELTMGRDSRKEMIDVLMQEAIDDTIDEVTQHGKSSNDN